MKRLRWLLVLLVLVGFLLPGCATTSELKKFFKDALWGDFVSIPSPQPGLVLPINSSPGVWVECWLLEGSFRDLIIPHPTRQGRLAFAKTPIRHFTVNPPTTRPYSNGVMSTAITVPLLLSPFPAEYTLLVFHKNFRNWVVEIETIHFSTTGNPFHDYYMSGGRKIYADRVIELARVSPYEHRRFKFHRTFYPGHALLEALGML